MSANELETRDARNTTPAEASSQREVAQSARQPALTPQVDVLEDEGGITLLADLPGVPKDQLTLHVEGDRLEIEGQVVSATPEGLQPVYAELRTPRYRRAFTLSRELDSARIEANLKDGVLNLRIPKHEHAQPRRVQVNVG